MKVITNRPGQIDPRKLLECIYERDRETFFANLHRDFVCHTPGASQIAGAFPGVEGMQRHIRQMAELTDSTFRPRHQGVFLTDGAWGFVPVHLVARRGSRQLDQPAFGVWRFHDGKVIEHWENPADMKAFDAFWA